MRGHLPLIRGQEKPADGYLITIRSFIQYPTQTVKITVNAISKYLSLPPRPQRARDVTLNLGIHSCL